MNLTQMYKTYVELKPYGEKYEIEQPTISANNLIIGTLYMDLSGKSTIKNMTTGDIAILEYHKRGWTAANAFRIDGDIMNNKKEVIYKLDGGWNDKISIMNPKPKSEPEVLWTKAAYPEKWEYIYGMSHFVL
jgi:hypothetical protein